MVRAAGVFGALVVPKTPPVDPKAREIGPPSLESDLLEGTPGMAGLLSAKR